MGNYVSEADILTDMPQMPSTNSAGYTETSNFITAAITDAEAVVDAYLGAKYSLPFSPVPPLVRKLAKDIAIHQAYSKIYPGDNIVTNAYSEKYEGWEKNAYSMLEQLRNDEMVLTQTDGTLVSPVTAAQSVRGTHENRHAAFNVDEPHQWDIDDDLIDDAADDRA